MTSWFKFWVFTTCMIAIIVHLGMERSAVINLFPKTAKRQQQFQIINYLPDISVQWFRITFYFGLIFSSVFIGQYKNMILFLWEVRTRLLVLSVSSKWFFFVRSYYELANYLLLNFNWCKRFYCSTYINLAKKSSVSSSFLYFWMESVNDNQRFYFYLNLMLTLLLTTVLSVL